MSSKSYVEPLILEVRPSRLIAMLVLTIHVMAALVCVQVPIPLFSRLVLLLAVIGSLVCNGVLYRRRTPRRLSWSLEQGWRITSRDGQELEVELLPELYLGAWLVIVRFRDNTKKTHTVMLAQDSARLDGLRRLRVLLRYGVPKH
ncbi:MAG TPA: protein YgfX [Gammaproteobacteria bacterium]|nr:protein YgfX [Gammaproteobacteria bacterium]